MSNDKPFAISRYRVAVAAWFALVLLLCLLAGGQVWSEAHATHAMRLQALSQNRASQVALGLRAQHRVASYLHQADSMAVAIARWRQEPTQARQDELIHDLQLLGRAANMDGVSILDRQGTVLLVTTDNGPWAPEREAMALARRVEPGAGPALIEILPGRGGRPPSIQAAILIEDTDLVAVLRQDLRRVLQPLIDRWPVPSESGRLDIWSVDADGAHWLLGGGAASAPSAPAAGPAVQARAARWAVPGAASAGVSRVDDGDGHAVLMIDAKVPDWPLVVTAQIRRSEVRAGATRNLAWVAGMGCALAAAGVFGLSWWHRRGQVMRLRDQRAAEAALRDVRERLSLALLASGMGVWELDLVRQRYFWSLEVWRLVGRAVPPGGVQEPIDPQVVVDGIVEEDRDSVKQAMADAVRRGTPFVAEFRIRRDDGNIRWVLDLGRVIHDDNGRPVRMLGTVQDVTARKQIEQELDRHRRHLQDMVDERTEALMVANRDLVEARDRAEDASRAKSAFLANMSHELRTPLNAVIGMAHLMRRDAVDDQTVQRAQRVTDAGRKLLQMLNDVLDMARIEAGHMTLSERDFSLSAMLQACLEPHRRQAMERGLRFDSMLEVDHDAVRGDPVRLQQILDNLLSNAIRFTQQGTVTVRVQTTPLPEGAVELQAVVVDTGIGIAPGVLAELFRPFAQGDSSTTRRHDGAGLGLMIARWLVQRMGGELVASSTPGEGSRFAFTARLRLADAAGDAAGRVAQRPLPTARQGPPAEALLVAENPITRELLVELLRQAGVAVVERDQLDGPDPASTTPAPSLIVLVAPAPQVLAGAAAAWRRRGVPVVTADSDDGAPSSPVDASDGHLKLPIGAAALQAELARLLRDGVRVAGPARPPDRTGSSGADLDGRVARLRVLLREGDFAATDWWEAMAADMDLRHGQRAGRLSRALRRLDYAEALAALDEIEPPVPG